MKRIFAILAGFWVILSLNDVRLARACGCDGWAYDWAEVNIIEENPSEGKIVFSIQCFWTCADGWDREFTDIPPMFEVYRPGDCIDEPYHFSYSTPGWNDFDKYRYCATYCWPGCACACPPDCGCHNHSYHDYTSEFYGFWGSFQIKAHFKGETIFSREFEFPETTPSTKLLSIVNIWFNDYSGQQRPKRNAGDHA